MGCDTSYLYEDIFIKCGSIIRTLLLDPTSLVTDPTNQKYTNGLQEDDPDFEEYPIYEHIVSHDDDKINAFKGVLVWTANGYYTNINDTPPDETYEADAGFYIVPSFGDVIIRSNVEYKQMLAIAFDSNVDFDHDPYGFKITRIINVFVNNLSNTLERDGNENAWGGDRPLYVRIARIVKNPRTDNMVFQRRTVVIELRYCHCY